MNRLPSFLPVLAGALAASACALFLLGWNGRPLAGAFVIATAALGILPVVLLVRMATAGATPRPARRRPPAEPPTVPFARVGGLDDAGLAAIVDAWADADTDVWAVPRR